MSEEVNVTYHEVDFLLPVHRFNIRFSYVTKKGLPFVREFVLRLVHISPMMPAELAAFLGLSKIEVDEAIGDLIDKGDLQFSENGQVDLTSKSRGYFVGLGSIPLVSSLLESGGQFSFELASFNCVGRKRTNEKWVSGLKLEVQNETVANSERFAKRKFQENFHKIQEQGFWEHKSLGDESGRPSIYTMESARKLGQEPLRLTSLFTIDPEGIPVERDDFEILDESSAVQDLVTSAIALAQKPTNLKKVEQAMAAFGDQEIRALLNDRSFDVVKLMLSQQAGQLDSGKWMPFVGPIYSKENWQLVNGYIKQYLTVLKKSKDVTPDFLWIAPSDGFWGQSPRISGCFSELVDSSETKGENPIRLCNPKLYLPVQSSTDRRGINHWKQEFPGLKYDTYGLVEGFMDGNVEVLLLPNYMAVVCYHISRPENMPVSLPLGYITTDERKVKAVAELAQEYVRGMISFENPRDIGPFGNL